MAMTEGNIIGHIMGLLHEILKADSEGNVMKKLNDFISNVRGNHRSFETHKSQQSMKTNKYPTIPSGPVKE